LIGGLDTAAAAGIQGANIYNQNQNYGGNQSMLPQQGATPYNYGQAGSQINQMGQNQVAPAAGLGTNPYY